MIFSIFGGRLGLWDLRDCRKGGGSCFWRGLCAWILRENLLRNGIGKAKSGGGIRSNEIVHYGKSLISIFQELFARIDKIVILAGGLRTKVSFYGV